MWLKAKRRLQIEGILLIMKTRLILGKTKGKREGEGLEVEVEKIKNIRDIDYIE